MSFVPQRGRPMAPFQWYPSCSATGATEVNVQKLRVKKKASQSTALSRNGDVHHEDCRCLCREAASFPIYSPRVETCISKMASETSAAREELEDEGPVGHHQDNAVSAEGPIGGGLIILRREVGDGLVVRQCACGCCRKSQSRRAPPQCQLWRPYLVMAATWVVAVEMQP